MSRSISTPSYFVIMPAAGVGLRFGGDVKKQYIQVSGKSLLRRTVDFFLKDDRVLRLVVCVPEADVVSVQNLMSDDSRLSVIEGGMSRAHSVREGVRYLKNCADEAVILVHDAVRPCVSRELVDRVLVAVEKFGAAVPGIAVADTIKRINREGFVSETPPRQSLRAIQTPQGFRAGILRQAYLRVGDEIALFTDEAMLVETPTQHVFCVEGDPDNIKVTRPEDLEIATRKLSEGL